MRLKNIIFITIVFVLFLTGCHEFSDTAKLDSYPIPPSDYEEQEKEFASYRYREGKDGVEITRFFWTDEEEVVIPEQID